MSGRKETVMYSCLTAAIKPRLGLRPVLLALAVCNTLLPLQGPVEAQTATPSYLANGDVPPDVENLRRNMLSPTVNALTFQAMDRLFETRMVPRAGPVWQLPHEDAAMPSYQFNGKTYSVHDFEQHTFTNALLVIRDGKVVYEHYRNNSGPDTHFISFSMAKSVTSMVTGIAVQKGFIKSIDDPITRYIPELSKSGYATATIRDLLEMRSGVDYQERYDFGEHPSVAAQIFENTLVENKRRFADFAFDVRSKFPAGEHFNYSTLDTAVMGWVLERAIGEPLSHFMAENLWEPAGMESYGYWLADGKPGVGREMNGMGFDATLSDYGRLGQMMLDNGRANGRQILSPEWVKQSTAMKPIPVEAGKRPGHPGYGFFWWQVDDSGAYVAIGLQGQFIYVHPASKTVIVKLSYFPPGDNANLSAESVAFFQAVTHQKF